VSKLQRGFARDKIGRKAIGVRQDAAMHRHRADIRKIEIERPAADLLQEIGAPENLSIGRRCEKARPQPWRTREHLRVVVAEHHEVATLDPKLDAAIRRRPFAREIAECDDNIVAGHCRAREKLEQLINTAVNVTNKNMAAGHISHPLHIPHHWALHPPSYVANMRRHQYRLSLVDPHSFQLRDSLGDVLATITLDRDDRAAIHTTAGRFSVSRAAVMAKTSPSGIYELEDKLQWKPLSLWHGVYGWTFRDGSVAVRFVPAASENSKQFLITVERPISDEIRVIAIGAYLLTLTGTDFVAWSAVASAVKSS